MKAMPQRKNGTEVEAEIQLLRNLQPTVPVTNDLGDDHRAAIGAQIAVLEKCMSLDTVHEIYGDAYVQYVFDAALNAYDWMIGDLTEEEGKPSDEWAALVA